MSLLGGLLGKPQAHITYYYSSATFYEKFIANHIHSCHLVSSGYYVRGSEEAFISCWILPMPSMTSKHSSGEPKLYWNWLSSPRFLHSFCNPQSGFYSLITRCFKGGSPRYLQTEVNLSGCSDLHSVNKAVHNTWSFILK